MAVVGDPEVDRDDIEEGRLGEDHAEAAKIGGNLERDTVAAGADRRQAGNMQGLGAGAAGKSAARDDLDAQRQPVRLVFAEWYKVPFIVDAFDRSPCAEGKQAVARAVPLVVPSPAS